MHVLGCQSYASEALGKSSHCQQPMLSQYKMYRTVEPIDPPMQNTITVAENRTDQASHYKIS